MAIKLTIKYSGPETEEGLEAYNFKAEVIEAIEIPAKIFVYQRAVPSATDAEANALGDGFTSIADPLDLEQYPEDSPDLANDIPYYRTDSVELVFRSMEELNEVRTLMDDNFKSLVRSMKALADTPVSEEIVYE